jgi:hypothetical protein
MALGSTQPLTEMSTRNLAGDKGQPACKAANLTAICEPTVCKMWEPRRLTTLWASKACYKDSFTLFFTCAVESGHEIWKMKCQKSLYKSDSLKIVIR